MIRVLHQTDKTDLTLIRVYVYDTERAELIGPTRLVRNTSGCWPGDKFNLHMRMAIARELNVPPDEVQVREYVR